MLRYLRLTVLNRTSRSRKIRDLAALTDAPRAVMRATRTADVVVPIYGSYDETKALLRNLADDPAPPGRVILVDDASPEPRMLPMLQEASAGREGWQLLENSSNLGFVGTCNRGIAASNVDVIVLNTDTEVPPGALRRVADTLQSASNIATATPFSNSAYGVGFPQLNYPNPRPFGTTTLEINDCFASLPISPKIDLPRGVGFCMGISRAVVQRIGGFSAEFGRGYGEDAGFSLEAARLGMRNVVAANAYVFHIGGQSFGGSWQDRSRRATLKILARYPEYLTMVDDYLASGQAHAICFVALVLLAEKKSGSVVQIEQSENDSVGRVAGRPAPARLRISRHNAGADAVLALGEERYRFKFANAQTIDHYLSLLRRARRR
ncbi:MAG: glycosyltransferase family 2 protein [Pseudomonadota bacterium]